MSIRGSQWGKWDLHVHTPESVTNNYGGDDSWENFISDIESLDPDFKVLGINDYLSFSGYEKVLDYREDGRLHNIETVLPVVEFRLDKFVGSSGHLARINYHVIFEENTDPVSLKEDFLYRISHPGYEIQMSNGSVDIWNGRPIDTDLEKLGELLIKSAPEAERKNYSTPLKEGHKNVSFPLEVIEEALRQFGKKHLIAVGKAEWDKLKWGDATIAEKKSIITKSDLLFTAAETPEAWKRAQNRLNEQQVNSKLLDCSDAHTFSWSNSNKDRIGNCFSWIKAECTLAGLKQAIREYDHRVYVGTYPNKISIASENPTKFIDSIEYRRISESKLPELWFDDLEISLNNDLVAIIGNKGSGKSALADTLGLLGQTRNYEDFSFLSQDKFRDARDNKAKHFDAVLKWQSGVEVFSNLADDPDSSKVETVKYIPQNFLEKLCNKDSLRFGELNPFEEELNRVIFSQIPTAQRLGFDSLKELWSHQCETIIERRESHIAELKALNKRIVDLETKEQPEFRKNIQSLLDQKTQELEALERARPTKVEKPVIESEEWQTKETNLDNTEESFRVIKTELKAVEQERNQLMQSLEELKQLKGKLENLEIYFSNFKNEVNERFDLLEIDLSRLVELKVDYSLISSKQNELKSKAEELDKEFDQDNPDSLKSKSVSHEKQIQALRKDIDDKLKHYRNYVDDYNKWLAQREEIKGTEKCEPGTISGYQNLLDNLSKVPLQLNDLYEKRLGIVENIFEEFREECSVLQNYLAHIESHMNSEMSELPEIPISFDVQVKQSHFETKFFEQIKRNVSGAFYGDEGRERFRSELKSVDFNQKQSLLEFLKRLQNLLRFASTSEDKDSKPAPVSNKLRQGVTLSEFYDSVFSLSYLSSRFVLKFGDKEVYQLSPGERGLVLLIFYLLADVSQIPLLIDQPEENLDNQTIFEVLVPCIRTAKQRRQVIIVTHNPNIAVVCDAEQVIHCSIDRKEGSKVTYQSGAIENPEMNKLLLNILEGTEPAFEDRDRKYIRDRTKK